MFSFHVASSVRRLLLLVICLALGGAAVSAERPCSVRVVDPRCEYLADPLGIDVRQPRLSWRLESVDAAARGQKQTVYQVQVAGTYALLEQGKPDLWDSGMVASDRSAHVVYAGKPLVSGTPYFWRVRVKDHSGAFSAWSPLARWTMGLLETADWSAKWIGCDQVFKRQGGWPPPDNKVPDPWLRKAFELKARPERAVIYVASVGYHEVYVNGQRIGDSVLAPAVANHRKWARYVAYEIGDQLKEGSSGFCVLFMVGYATSS
ncbi:MAG TPA: alpha-L-rhamnosidase N-terminal domain-containing protein [Sedimentisphaerales bacterium]|nr:alpha-L-rhamnosidase N-terminal domain-containing protein [Sedimentisphaerales bacterium]